MVAGRQVGFDARLDRFEPELLEPGSLSPGERLVLEVAERRPPPKRQRFAQCCSCCRRIQVVRLFQKTLESLQVEFVDADSK